MPPTREIPDASTFSPFPVTLLAELEHLARTFGAPLVQTVDLALRGYSSPRLGQRHPTSLEELEEMLKGPGREVEVCLVIRRPNGKILVESSAYYPGGIARLFTGGVEPGETLLAAAKREALEETGLHTIVRRFLAAVAYRTTYTLALGHADPIFHTFAFLLDEIGGTLGTLDKKERFDEFRELTLEELSALVAELERVDGLPAEAIGAASLAFAASKGIDPCVGQDWLRFRIPAHRVVAEALRRTETG
jgi:NAD+ diphosphatase